MAGPRTEAPKVGLPPRAFLYTVDQIAEMLSVTPRQVHEAYLYYDGLNVGGVPPRRMRARNINPEYSPPSHASPEGKGRPEWRISEAELIRWLKVMGFRIYDRGWVS